MLLVESRLVGFWASLALVCGSRMGLGFRVGSGVQVGFLRVYGSRVGGLGFSGGCWFSGEL